MTDQLTAGNIVNFRELFDSMSVEDLEGLLSVTKTKISGYRLGIFERELMTVEGSPDILEIIELLKAAEIIEDQTSKEIEARK